MDAFRVRQGAAAWYGSAMRSKVVLVAVAAGLLAGVGGCKRNSSTTLGGPVAVVASGSAAPAAATVDPGAEAFVRALYAKYAASGDFSPMLHEDEVFTPALVKMLKHDEKMTPKGEIGTIEADPICQCQDSGGMKLQSVATTATGTDKADAQVGLQFDKPASVLLKLVKVPGGGWRVDDALGDDGMGLRQRLKDAKY